MKKILFIFIFVLLFSFLGGNSANAICQDVGGLVPCGSPNCPCQFCHFFVMLKRIYDFVLGLGPYKGVGLVPVVAVLMVVIGGFMYITAYMGGLAELEGEKKGGPVLLKRANDLFKYVVWGLIVVYGAHIFISALLTVLGWRWGKWWEIC